MLLLRGIFAPAFFMLASGQAPAFDVLSRATNLFNGLQGYLPDQGLPETGFLSSQLMNVEASKLFDGFGDDGSMPSRKCQGGPRMNEMFPDLMSKAQDLPGFGRFPKMRDDIQQVMRNMESTAENCKAKEDGNEYRNLENRLQGQDFLNLIREVQVAGQPVAIATGARKLCMDMMRMDQDACSHLDEVVCQFTKPGFNVNTGSIKHLMDTTIQTTLMDQRCSLIQEALDDPKKVINELQQLMQNKGR